jgi:hypothetical protein
VGWRPVRLNSRASGGSMSTDIFGVDDVCGTVDESKEVGKAEGCSCLWTVDAE